MGLGLGGAIGALDDGIRALRNIRLGQPKNPLKPLQAKSLDDIDLKNPMGDVELGTSSSVSDAKRQMAASREILEKNRPIGGTGEDFLVPFGKGGSTRINYGDGRTGQIGNAALRPVGKVLQSIDDVMANPQLLKGRSPLEVEGILGKTKGWQIEKLRHGSQKGNGWVLREYTSMGNETGRQLRWHPGGGHHGPQPYWRVGGYNGDLGGIIR